MKLTKLRADKENALSPIEKNETKLHLCIYAQVAGVPQSTLKGQDEGAELGRERTSEEKQNMRGV